VKRLKPSPAVATAASAAVSAVASDAAVALAVSQLTCHTRNGLRLDAKAWYWQCLPPLLPLAGCSVLMLMTCCQQKKPRLAGKEHESRPATY